MGRRQLTHVFATALVSIALTVTCATQKGHGPTILNSLEKNEPGLDDLKAEIARLTTALTQAQADRPGVQGTQTAEADSAELAGSRAETARALREGRNSRRAAIDAALRHHFEIKASANHLGAAEGLIAELRASEAARQAAEQQQQILNQELSHRLKNTLTMVQAIAAQTLRGVADQSAIRTFNDRLLALSTAHDVLMRQNWSPAPLREIAHQVLGLHTGSSALTMTGPDLRLSSRASLSLSLLLHELATNATKYGAWSVPDGKVDLRWSIKPGEQDTPDLLLVWQEHDGPPVEAPSRRGFGSRLIGMGFGTGTTTLHWGRCGFSGEFQAPLPQLIEVSATE